jgi:hypothetical protein
MSPSLVHGWFDQCLDVWAAPQHGRVHVDPSGCESETVNIVPIGFALELPDPVKDIEEGLEAWRCDLDVFVQELGTDGSPALANEDYGAYS